MIACDLLGKRFGQLTVMQRIPGAAQKGVTWNCRCDCGNEVTTSTTMLNRGGILRCKYCRVVDLRGQRFGKLTVIDLEKQPAHDKWSRNLKARWRCLCDCGNEIVTRTDYLRAGRTKSCGCLFYGLRKENHGACWNQVITKLKKNAMSRNIAIDLSGEQILRLARANCQYCGAPPAQLRRTLQRDEVRFNGIDRLDYRKPYTVENTVSCCGVCNCAKNTMTVQEFAAWVRRIHRRVRAWESLDQLRLALADPAQM